MWQRLGLGAVIFLSIVLLFGGGILFGSRGREDDKDGQFIVGFGLGLAVSGFLGLMIMAGLTT